MSAEQIAIYLMGTDEESVCLACQFSVERLMEMLHRNNIVFCWAHAHAAVAYGDTLARPVVLDGTIPPDYTADRKRFTGVIAPKWR